jgi:protein gp37
MNYIGDTIGWADISANMIDGACKYQCPDCYEQRRRKRFKLKKEITYNPAWYDQKKINWFVKKYHRQPKVFICDNHDLFGPWIDSGIIGDTIDKCKEHPEATFQFLTQNPKRYQEFDWPDNCWLGTTVRTQEEYNERAPLLLKAKAKLHFLSAEPLLGPIKTSLGPHWVDGPNLQWLIVGCKTPYHKDFKIEWLEGFISRMTNAVWVKQLPNVNGKADKDMTHWPEWARRREWPK